MSVCAKRTGQVVMYLVCGEALFDFFLDSDGQTTPGHLLFDAVVGGSPYNVAKGLSRLNCPAALCTGISTDFLGQYLLSALQDEGINRDYLLLKSAPTTLSLVDLTDQGEAQYVFHGHDAADRSIESHDLLYPGDEIVGLHFGSYSIVAEPTANSFATLAQREKDRRFISLDPNVRMNVEMDRGVWRKRVKQMLDYADLVKLSEEDFHNLYPDKEAKKFLPGWLDSRPVCVLYTQGKNGISLFHNSGSFSVSAPPVEVIDTVGAGDSIQAAFLCGLLELGALSTAGLSELSASSLKTLLEFSVEAAAITCSRRGADLPFRNEIRTAL